MKYVTWASVGIESFLTGGDFDRKMMSCKFDLHLYYYSCCRCFISVVQRVLNLRLADYFYTGNKIVHTIVDRV